MRRILLIAAALIFLGSLAAQAQTVLSVDIAKAKLSWTPGAGGGTVAEYRVKCGTATGIYTIIKAVPAPGTSIGVLAVIPGPGTFFCAVSAANVFGESGLYNEVNFAAGNVPATPTNTLIQSQ